MQSAIVLAELGQKGYDTDENWKEIIVIRIIDNAGLQK